MLELEAECGERKKEGAPNKVIEHKKGADALSDDVIWRIHGADGAWLCNPGRSLGSK